MKSPITIDSPGKEVLFAGNEAIARACIEAGVSLVTGYPGTPTSPVIEILKHEKASLEARWAVNEKVAMDIATGHSWAGLRSMVTMKMSGLNVASDTVLSVAASGTVGGLVIYVGDDPNVYYGMVEQDSRYYALLASAPMLVPANPQEMLEFTRFAFDLSEKIGGPVFLRSTTVLSYTYSKVTLGEIRRLRQKAHFTFDIDRYTKAGSLRCLAQHQEALNRVEQASVIADSLNVLTKTGSDVGVIASSLSWDYLMEVMEKHDLDLTRLKVSTAHPAPRGKIASLISSVKKVIILEELEPVLEMAVRSEATRTGVSLEIFGKEDGLLSRVGDLSPDIIRDVISKVLGRDLEICPGMDIDERVESMKVNRLLTFCAGCPHRSSYYALQKAMRELGMDPARIPVTGDVGCTILGINEPFNICWTEVSMGNSIGLASGFAGAGIEGPVVAVLGDGTFYHSGIPPVIDAVAAGRDQPLVILDNNWMSMTGYQENPGTRNGESVSLPIERVLTGVGVRKIWIQNPYKLRSTVRTFKKLLTSKGVNAVILRAPCVARQPTPLDVPVVVKKGKCTGFSGCEKTCIEALACPAIARDDDTVYIERDYCMSCGLCGHYCPEGAIKRKWLSTRRRKVGI